MPVTATFDAVRYGELSIAVDVDLSEKVVSFHATDFTIQHVSGSEVYDFEVFLTAKTGKPLERTLTIVIPKDLSGVFALSLNSNIVKRSNGLDDTIFTVLPLTLPYDTREPFPVDVWLPDSLFGGLWDVYLDMGMNVTDLAQADISTEGVALPTPHIYRWTGSRAPNLDGTDRASTTPADAYTDPDGTRNNANLVATLGNWTQINQAGNTVEAQYFLLRFINPAHINGTTNIIVAKGAVSGPTGENRGIDVTFPAAPARAATFTAGTAFTEKWLIYGSGVTARAVTGLPNGVTAAWNPASPSGTNVHALTLTGTTLTAFTARVNLTTANGTFSETFPFTVTSPLQAGGFAAGSAEGQGGAIGPSTPAILEPYPYDPTQIPLDTAWETYFPIPHPLTSFTYASTLTLNSANTTPQGAAWVEKTSEIWVANDGDNSAYLYNASNVYQKKYALLTGNTAPRGLDWIPELGEVWCVDNTAPRYIYCMKDSEGTEARTRIALNTSNTSPEGGIYVKSRKEFWVLNKNDRKFYRYNVGATSAAIGAFLGTYDLHTNNTEGRGGTYCETSDEVFVVNGTTVYVYNARTGGYVKTFALHATNTTPRACLWMPNTFWCYDDGLDRLVTYTLAHTAHAEVTVDGLLKEQFAYDYQSARGRVAVAGLIDQTGSGTWLIQDKVTAQSTPSTQEVTWNVIGDAIVITPISNLKLPRDRPIDFTVPMRGDVTGQSTEGLQIGLKSVESAEGRPGARIQGDIPDDNEFSKTADAFTIRASGPTPQNYVEGGETLLGTKGIQPYAIIDTAPVLGAVTATSLGSDVTIDFQALSEAIGYEWRITPPGDNPPGWNYFDSTYPIIDPRTVKVTPGHLNVTLEFPNIAAATTYAYQLVSGESATPWTRFTGTLENTTISTIIPNLEEGVAYDLMLRVASPWVGTPITLKIRGGRLCYVLERGSQQSWLYIFSSGHPEGTQATRIKRLRLPAILEGSSAHIDGLAVNAEGDVFILNTNSTDEALYTFEAATIASAADGSRLTRDKRNPLPAGSWYIYGLAAYKNELYVYINSSAPSGWDFIRVIPEPTTDGATLTTTRGSTSKALPKEFGMSVTDEVIYWFLTNNQQIVGYDRELYTGLPRIDLYNSQGSAVVSDPLRTGLKVIGNAFYTVTRDKDRLEIYRINPEVHATRYIRDFALSLPAGLANPAFLDIIT